MAESQGVGKTINTWVQTVFIVIAAMWGIYTFVYKEITIPRSAPINITMNLELKQIGTRESNNNKEEPLSAVEMKISATNPSSREVYLLPNVWIARGVKIAAADNGKTFAKGVNDLLKSGGEGYIDKHSTVESQSQVATGILFPDDSIRPNETITRTIIFYVPDHRYDLIVVTALMPTVGKANKLALDWACDEDGGLSFKLFRINTKGEREPMPLDQSGRYADATVGLQMAKSVSELSLWRQPELKPPAD